MKYDSIPSHNNNVEARDDGRDSSSMEQQQLRQGGILPYKKLLFAMVAMAGAVSLAARRASSSTTTDATGAAFSDILPLLQEPHHTPSSLLSVSSRGPETQPLESMAVFYAASADAFHPTKNRDGYLVMLLAENKLMIPEMAAKLQQATQDTFPAWVFTYGEAGGQIDFKASVAKIMEKWIPRPVDPKFLRFQAGAGTILSCLSWLLADANDGVLVTGPNYSAFAMDFNMYGRVKLHVASTQARHGYLPTVADLDACYQKSQAAGNPPKILIICQPNNPTGLLYPPEIMELMISWALSKGLHVVSDEIYALSVFPGYHTTSAAHVMSARNPSAELYLSDHVHIVAGLSKDWGMSGFRVGSLFSHNTRLLQAMDLLGYYQSVSEYTQYALTKVLEDDEWVDWYIAENQRRLAATFSALQEALALIGVSLFPSHGGIFAWADFSSFLREGQSEEDLWQELFHGPKVLFTPGASCNAEKPGMFRVVYAWPEGGVDAMEELGRRLVKWKAQRCLS